MTKLEMLTDLAENKENLSILYRPLKQNSTNKLIGLYVWDPIAPCILLDESLKNNYRKQITTLSEEVGHHITGIRRNFMITDTYQDRITIAKDETQAMRWATDYLIPDVELAYAVSELNLRSCWELADYFEVTQPFMWKKLGFLRSCFRATGIKVRSRDIFTVNLVPCNLNKNHS
ncbi:protein of unknown function [Desulfotomaculum arcticum]|uniref:IrrE N-terminal-like domain-containing protein n=1 Tax=Desulfotruncus arcticus DSM 17038 TaxID=1121424 RepID=A0A1I2ZEU9_9FIRM|nr:ImmA/IrrE family metallo-endopeptidase [Desulfotruncus arcticus]SFH36230.1 protein of unknown function [Desulfotomaculum arcticum] [Desulfotruncus arcticus DSM 17038]